MTFRSSVAIAGWAMVFLLSCLLSWSAALAQDGPQPVVYDSDPLIIETQTGPVTFRIELALSPDQRATGLMFRKSMPENAGMLFDFGQERQVTMWMRNTYLPLDMIFISQDGTIRTIARDTVPFSETVVPSGVPVRYVLEINSGLTDIRGITVGDRVKHPAIAGPDG